MHPAEEIVTFWLKQKGYFTMNEIKVRYGKEIDILAMNPLTGNKLHVEVTVPIKPVIKGGITKWVNDVVDKKFVGKDSCVERKVEEYFETARYRKILVVGNLGEYEIADVKEGLKDVELIRMKDILRQVVEKMKEEKGVYMDTAGRYIQILSAFL